MIAMSDALMPARRRIDDAAGRLAADQRGASAMEFAIIAAPFIAIMVAILQVALTFFAQQNLETATAKASRQLMTGSDQAAGMTKAQFLASVCAQLPAFMKCANVMVDVRSTTDFSSASTTSPTLTYDTSGNVNNSWSYAPGGSGQITTVKAMYVWQTSKGPLGFDLSTLSNANRLLIATAVFKTEPSGS